MSDDPLFPSRADYLNRVVDHETYYQAINKTAGFRLTRLDHAFLLRVRDSMNTGDWHLNRINLHSWDAMAMAHQRQIATALRKHGDFWSLGGGVCAMKQAARDAAMELLPAPVNDS